jgi:4-diphosphocytidyl-2-C-methyl-D-erythritol kinase
LDDLAAGLFNALQPTVYRKYPLLEIINNKLEKAGAKGVLLSGSGSTIFALAESRGQGRRLAARIRAAVDCPLWTCLAQAPEEG